MKLVATGGTIESVAIKVPGDKSISHRAVMMGAIADGTSTVRGCLLGADVRSTIQCFRDLGVAIAVDESTSTVIVEGNGMMGLQAPRKPLDAGNAGICMRLLSGILHSARRFVCRRHDYRR